MVLADACRRAPQFRSGLQKHISKREFSRLQHSTGLWAAQSSGSFRKAGRPCFGFRCEVRF